MNLRDIRSEIIVFLMLLDLSGFVSCYCASAEDIWRSSNNEITTVPRYSVPQPDWDKFAPAKEKETSVFLNQANVRFIKDPRSSTPSEIASNAVGGESTFMLGPFFVVDKYAEAKTNRDYLLLARPKNTSVSPIGVGEADMIGWVDSRKCLEYWHPDSPKGLRSPRTQILRKCMLVNSFQDIEAKAAKDLKAAVTFYDRPNSNDKRPLRQRALFEVYYVYDMVSTGDVQLSGFINTESIRERVTNKVKEILRREVEAGNLPGPFVKVDTSGLTVGTPPKGAGPEDDISRIINESIAETIPGMLITKTSLQREFLLGSEPTWRSPKTILGWVPYPRLCEWNTVECVEIRKDNAARRKREARVFGTRDEIKAYLNKYKLLPDDPVDDPIAKEDLRGEPWNYFKPRWPLISDMDEELQGFTIKGVTTYKIGFIGDVFGKGNNGSEKLVSAADIQKAQERVNRLLEDVRTIQILFVIDSTYSMDDWYNGVIAAVQTVMQASQFRTGAASISPRVEFSMNFYRDFGEERHKVFESYPFMEEADAISILRNQKTLCVGGSGNGGEAMYHGIAEAVKVADFKANSVKLVFLIGDDGNRPDAEGSISKCLDEFVKKGSDAFPIGFFAIGVNDPAIATREDEHQHFMLSAEELSKELRAAELMRYEKMDINARKSAEALAAQKAVVRKGGPNSIADGIRIRFALAMLEVDAALKYLEALRQGETTPESSDTEGTMTDYQMVFQLRHRKLIEDAGLKPLELAKNGVQLFQKGWIAERDPHDPSNESAFRVMALSHKPELRRQIVLLDSLTRQWDNERIQETWVAALSQLTGEEVQLNEEQSPDVLMRQHIGIAVKQSDLLKLSFKELQTLPPEQLNRLFADISYYMERMDDVYDEKDSEYKPGKRLTPKGTEVPTDNVRSKRGGDHKYWWGVDPEAVQAGENLRAWIPRSYLP